MGMIIQHMHSTQYLVDKKSSSNSKLKKAAERLSSGYRINRASDDAAGLAVSEKLRTIRRGLCQGLRNIDDGINYSRTVESASQEMHNMLHRLKELAIQSANGTYDDEVDRAALDLEYQAIIDEIDQMTDTAHFNEVPLFDKHLSEYEKADGVIVHNKPVEIDKNNDTLIIGYTVDDKQLEYTMHIPHGTYKAGELADIIDTDMFDKAPELIIGMNKDNQYTMQVEGGKLDHISGNAYSLFYETVIGSSDGYLLGVTTFSDDNVRMRIYDGVNDTISFRVGNNDDTLYSVTLDDGFYSRPALIDAINKKFQEAGIPGDVKAVPETNDDGKLIIGLASKKTITGLSGNFIKMDGITSPIYDICKYGEIDNTQAVFSGTKRIPSNMQIERDRNEYFVLDIKYYDDNGNQETKKLRIDLLSDGENVKTYATPNDLLEVIQRQLDDAGVPVTASYNTRGGLKFVTEQYGDKCDIELVKSDVPSGHMVYDLFDDSALIKLTPSRTTAQYSRAIFTAYKPLGPSTYIPADENTLSFKITLSDDNEASASEKSVINMDIVIPANTYSSNTALVQTLNDYIDNNYTDLADKLQFSIDASNTLKLYADGANGSSVEKIEVISSCSAYSRLIKGVRYYDNLATTNGSESVLQSSSTNVPGTSRPNVTSTTGNTGEAVTYKKEQSSTSQRSDTYVRYTGANISNVAGTTTYENIEGSITNNVLSATPAKLTLDEVLTQFSALGTSQKDITFTFDFEDLNGGTSYDILIPQGSTAAEAVNIIKDKLSGKAAVTQSGNDIVITSNHKGEEAKFSNVGGSLLNKASLSSLASNSNAVIDKTNNKVYVPATLTVKNAQSQIPYTADYPNDTLILSAGTHSYNLQLTHKTYTSLQDIADEINRLISVADGGTPATTVEANGNALIFTGPATESGSVVIDDASTCNIGLTKQVTSPSSSPYYNPDTGRVETPATIRAEGIDTHFPKTVTSSDNTITMDYTYPDPLNSSSTITEPLTITVPQKTYNSASELTSAINSAIAADPALNGKIKASYASSGSSKGLTFTTVKGGDGYKLSNLGGTMGVDKYINKANTSGGYVDQDNNIVKFPATASNNRYDSLFSGSGLEITDSNNFVSITVNGYTYEFRIRNDVYSGTAGRQDFTDQLRAGLAAANVTVTDSGSTLKITTNEGGAGKKITVNSAMTAPYFKYASTVSNPSSTRRTEQPCNILGKNSISSIEIKDYYNQMTFDYAQDGSTHQIVVDITPGTYTADALVQAIQDSINQTLPAGTLEVYKNSSGNIGIRSATITPIRSISNFEGGLFDKVFQDANYRVYSRHSETAGTSDGSFMTYIVGRNKLLPESEDEIASGKSVIIYPGLNDNVVFDLSYDGETFTFDFTIPQGEYTAKELAAAIQTAGRAEAATFTDKNGDPLPADGFFATIGLEDLGLPEPDTAIKSADKLVFCFRIPDDGSIEQSDCIIDGVRGNSAYRIFYDATKSPTPSKILAKSDLTNGVLIREGINDTFSFDIDGEEHTVTIPAGGYTCDQISNYLNEQYEAQGCIVRTVNQDGRLMFYTTENGSYLIDRFTGNAADTLFYDSDSRDSDTEIGIHTGRRTDTYIWYLKTRVDDHLMRINTTGITSAERAMKALNRLESATDYLSEWRSLTGANENRSRHSYAKNQAYIENLEAADSTLRDTDVAQEMAEFSKQQILMQAQNAMIEQTKQQHMSVLDVLA